MMLDEYDIKKLIAKSLYEKDIINQEIYDKCSKPHISNLPGDLRTNESEKLQKRYDELTNRINEIEHDWGWMSRYGHYEPDEARAKKMEFYGKKFKTIDRKIYKQCKDLINELKPLVEEADKLHKKYITEDNSDGYSVLTSYGELGMLNPYEEFLLFCDQFKSKNAGKGNQILESGFYTWNPDNFSFEKGNSYLNYVLSNILENGSYVMSGHVDVGADFSKEDMELLPSEKFNKIIGKIKDLKLDYNYELQKVKDNYKMKTMRKMNELRDYHYEKDKLEQYCKQNNININTNES